MIQAKGAIMIAEPQSSRMTVKMASQCTRTGRRATLGSTSSADRIVVSALIKPSPRPLLVEHPAAAKCKLKNGQPEQHHKQRQCDSRGIAHVEETEALLKNVHN